MSENLFNFPRGALKAFKLVHPGNMGWTVISALEPGPNHFSSGLAWYKPTKPVLADSSVKSVILTSLC